MFNLLRKLFARKRDTVKDAGVPAPRLSLDSAMGGMPVPAYPAQDFATVRQRQADDRHPEMYRVSRGSVTSERLATFEEVAGFLRACEIVEGSAQWEAALAGWPFSIDGATMRFTPVPPDRLAGTGRSGTEGRAD